MFEPVKAQRDKFIKHCVQNSEFFPQKLQSLARETPDAIAIKTEKSFLTFSDLDAAANQEATLFLVSELTIKKSFLKKINYIFLISTKSFQASTVLFRNWS